MRQGGLLLGLDLGRLGKSEALDQVLHQGGLDDGDTYEPDTLASFILCIALRHRNRGARKDAIPMCFSNRIQLLGLQIERYLDDNSVLSSTGLSVLLVVLHIRAWIIVSHVKTAIILDDGVEPIEGLQNGSLARLVLPDQTGNSIDVEDVRVPY